MPTITNPARLNDDAAFPGLKAALATAGLPVSHEFPAGIWTCRDAAAAQAVIDAYDPVPHARKVKIAAIKADGMSRVQLIFPAIADFDTLDLVSQIMQSVLPGARSLTTRVNTLSQIWTAGANAVAAVNAESTVAAINAVTPAWP